MGLSGSVDFDSARIKYTLEVGNGPDFKRDPHVPGRSRLIPNTLFDSTDSKQVAYRLTLTPRRPAGLSLGLFGTHFSMKATAETGVEDENIFGLDLHYTRGGLELLSEYFYFTNSDASSNAFYAQLSYSFDLLTPFTRYELLDVDESDPYMTALSGGFDRYQYIAGLRYDLDFLFSSVKAQYRYDHQDDDKDFNVFEAQWTFHY
jgi:hypothetical protein